METKRLHALAAEIGKTIKSSNTEFGKRIFNQYSSQVIKNATYKFYMKKSLNMEIKSLEHRSAYLKTHT